MITAFLTEELSPSMGREERKKVWRVWARGYHVPLKRMGEVQPQDKYSSEYRKLRPVSRVRHHLCKHSHTLCNDIPVGDRQHPRGGSFKSALTDGVIAILVCVSAHYGLCTVIKLPKDAFLRVSPLEAVSLYRYLFCATYEAGRG
jgi:hypothetical protein